MDNSTASSLTGETLLFTQLELVIPTTVAGLLYGVAFSLFCLYAHALVPRLRTGDRARQAKFMLSYSTVIMLCGLYSLISNAWVAQDAYIKHSDYPGGPYGYVDASFLTNPVISTGLVCQFVIDVLTSVIQVWRVWVIWSATRYAKLVIVVPLLCLLSFTGLQMRTLVLDITASLAQYLSLDDRTDQAETALQAATTILCTLLISLYLIYKQWQQSKLIGKSQGSTGYANIVAMIIESYTLESVWLLGIVIFWGKVPSTFFAESRVYIETIAYLLVQYRVASGKSYESQRQQRTQMSSLRWNHSNHVTTTGSGETGEIQESPHVSGAPEVPSVLQISRMA